jgi:hypothetical protein
MRFRDFKLNEFGATNPDDLIGSEPAPEVQQPVQQQPRPTPPAPVKKINIPKATSSASNSKDTEFGNNMASLVTQSKKLPGDHPFKQFIDHLVNAVEQAAVQPVSEVLNPSNVKIGPQSNRTAVVNVAKTYWSERLEQIRTVHGDAIANEFIRLAAEAEEKEGPIEHKTKGPLQNSIVQAIKTIKLDAYGEVFIKDAQIRDLADKKADALGMDKKWARNLIGMFDASVDYDNRELFLQLCEVGEALDVEKLIKMRKGTLEQVIADQPPSIKDVFKSIKGTLLDISLSTGQGAATGPFEAMLCIMGKARKADSGDLEIDIKGKPLKFEVKSSSLTVKKSTGISNAWLDAPSEMPPSKVKEMFMGVMGRKSVVQGSDFTKSGLPAMQATFANIRSNPERLQLIMNFHSQMFPSIADAPGYNFGESCDRILKSILASKAGNEQHAEIGKEQAVMALLEYMVGKGNDGFIFYNSSFQRFQVLLGIKEVLAASNNFPQYGLVVARPIQMVVGGAGTTRKGSPGLYFGPTQTSPEGKEYVNKIKSDPAWQKLYNRKV